MNPRLLYVMGPSGAGKDSVLGWLRARLGEQATVHWARRTITRRADAGGESHEALEAAAFAADAARGAFALSWRAHGLWYGIRVAELAPLERGAWVFVNGSRAHFGEAAARFPGLTGVLVTARPEVLRQRLAARGRESAEQILGRMARPAAPDRPGTTITIANDGALADAGGRLLEALRALPGWQA
ncbi:phosphonate metabolism protein/1,5-bisphosphokinase (PRPP-forming) PhnN [Paracidovorax anthurii]|uniref:Ribose 1,5-bisphosphate phosphokinase PhnN n=1 Tax=Paracidovorax anthurii TaxID=78229 RepID=A0A328ZJG5_9BURK|nr:phosphonate metabolism protein/1,5-bisphosphokinase (PRPP-forming) PhnN [Paracidovorax anthurii]RAR85485.1 ribose 1,5-bisphosphokinase [Paracidovorax anthurii]